MTSGITYIRTGAYYLNRTGPYREIFPEILSPTDGRAYMDYAFHLAPILEEHIDEIPMLIEEHGVPSFKIFMFYGAHGLHGRSADQGSFLMLPEDQSLRHRALRVRHARHPEGPRGRALRRRPRRDLAVAALRDGRDHDGPTPSSVEKEGKLTGLEAYSASRPPHSEGLRDHHRVVPRARDRACRTSTCCT